MYTILGASGNIGAVISRTLLGRGEKVRVVGRNTVKLQPFVQKGAEAFIGDIRDSESLTRAFEGARAAFTLIPPGMTSPDYRADQERSADSIATAAKNAGLQYAVNLSSIGAHAPSGTGPISGLHNAEKKFAAVEKLNVLHLRPAYFMENHLAGIGMIRMMGMFGGAVKGDLRIPMIATCDVGAFAAERLLKLDFNCKTSRELLGERDLTMNEVTAAMARTIGNANLRYMQFPYDQVQQMLVQMGTPPKSAAYLIEMFQGMNDGIVTNTEPRTEANTTPTSIEVFLKEVFLPAFQGKAVTA
jgi:uncharacterized protein YbjT (DUF2867 family)